MSCSIAAGPIIMLCSLVYQSSCLLLENIRKRPSAEWIAKDKTAMKGLHLFYKLNLFYQVCERGWVSDVLVVLPPECGIIKCLAKNFLSTVKRSRGMLKVQGEIIRKVREGTFFLSFLSEPFLSKLATVLQDGFKKETCLDIFPDMGSSGPASKPSQIYNYETK